jgi:hypothetical protein
MVSGGTGGPISALAAGGKAPGKMTSGAAPLSAEA